MVPVLAEDRRAGHFRDHRAEMQKSFPDFCTPFTRFPTHRLQVAFLRVAGLLCAFSSDCLHLTTIHRLADIFWLLNDGKITWLARLRTHCSVSQRSISVYLPFCDLASSIFVLDPILTRDLDARKLVTRIRGARG